MTMLLAVCGWIVWCFVALLSLHFLLYVNSDGGLRFLMRTQGVALAIALGITAVCDVSKLHLFWVVPLSPLIPMFLMTVLSNRALSRALTARKLAKQSADACLAKAKALISEFAEAYELCQDERWLFKPLSLLPCDPQTLAGAIKWSCQFQDNIEATHHAYLKIGFFIPDDQFERAHAYFKRHLDITEYGSSVYRDCATALEFLTQPPNAVAHGFFQRRFLVDAPADPDKAWVQELARKCWRGYLAQEVGWEAFIEKIESEDSSVESRELVSV